MTSETYVVHGAVIPKRLDVSALLAPPGYNIIKSVDVFLKGFHLNTSYYENDYGYIPSAVDALLFAGATVRFRRVDQRSLEARRVCSIISRVTASECWCNLYLSTAASDGLGRHADEHDVISIQYLGTKEWSVWRPGERAAASYLNSCGSFIYVPSRFDHEVTTTSKLTAHVAFGFQAGQDKICAQELCEELSSLLWNERGDPQLALCYPQLHLALKIETELSPKARVVPGEMYEDWAGLAEKAFGGGRRFELSRRITELVKTDEVRLGTLTGPQSHFDLYCVSVFLLAGDVLDIETNV